MVICVFGVTHRPDSDLELESRLVEKMADVASVMPGFISYKHYSALDGDDIGIIRFQSRDDLKRWRDHPAHRAAWEHAPRIYREFWVQNCETFDDCKLVDGVGELLVFCPECWQREFGSAGQAGSAAARMYYRRGAWGPGRRSRSIRRK